MEPIRVIREDLVLVDWGPMTLGISAWRGDGAVPVIAARAASFALKCLGELADFKNYLKLPANSLPLDRKVPPVVDAARRAAFRLEAGLTPLAAVAGATADMVADRARDLGADKVVVNNGGDIALLLGPGQEALVGLKLPDSEKGKGGMPGRLRVKAGMGIGGVATSGWSGRSFSKGVADLVTVWAESASLADAAATALGNEVRVESNAVETAPAASLDPESDLDITPVTKRVGALNPDEICLALENGLEAARIMADRSLIKGCVLVVQGWYSILDTENGLEQGSLPEPVSAL